MFVVRYVWCLKWKVLWFVSFAKNYYFFIVSLLLIMLGTEEATDCLTKSTLDCSLAVHVLININYYICFMDWASALCQTDYRSCHKQWSCAVLFGPTGAAVDSWYISGTNRISLTAFQVSSSIIIYCLCLLQGFQNWYCVFFQQIMHYTLVNYVPFPCQEANHSHLLKFWYTEQGIQCYFADITKQG